MLLSLLFLVACKTPCPECPPAKCPDAAVTLSTEEGTILQPYLDDVRQGVRQFGERPFGICKGARECDEYLGPDAGLLPPGEYFVRTEVKTPQLGEGWKIHFRADCEMTDASGNKTTQPHERLYDAKYAGKDRGYQLQPLWKIQSPHPNGARACTISLAPVRPDGTEGEPWKGAYSTPAPEPPKPK